MKRTALVVLGCLLAMPGPVRAQSGFPEVTIRPGQSSTTPDVVPPAVPLQPDVPREPLPLPSAYATPPLPETASPDSMPLEKALPTGGTYGPSNYKYSTVYPPHVDTIDVPPRPSLFRDYDDVFGGHRLWVETDYLLWWLRKAPIGVPLVTTGPFTDPTAGHLDDPLTHVLLGPGGFDSTATSGGRIRAGIWLEPFLGVEFAGMLFAPVRSSQSFASDASGIPILSRPVVIGGAEHSYDIAYPDHWNGSFSATSSTHLDGLEVNLVGFGLGPRELSMEFLAGVHYAHLGDELDLNQSIHNQIGMLAFNRLVDPGAAVSVLDQYRTTNQFYGGQLGARGEWTEGPFSLALSGKLGVGFNEQTLTVSGSTHLREANGATSDYAGGILANAANIGRYQASRFAVMPQLGVTLGYWITPNVRLSFGYSALYWTDVLRAGNQIDRRVNPIYVPLDMTYTPGATVVRQPPPMLRNDFWAEGLLFGAEFRY